MLLDTTGTDVLADVLNSLKLRGRIFCRCDLSAPWALGFAAGGISHFHLVGSGSCWLRLEGNAEAIPLEAGDLLLVTGGHGYQLSDELDTPPVPVDELVQGSQGGVQALLRHGGGGRATGLICGSFTFEGPDTTAFLTLLPAWIRVQKDEGGSNEWLDATLQFLIREIRNADVGAETIITSLIDVLFVKAVRTWLKQQPPGTAGWLGALRDPSIGAALALIHKAPEKRWTVPELSAAVGQSRSPFAAKFTALVGDSPMAYVKRWRLQLGASLLRDQALALSSVAERVGYESAAAFSRAFTREFGTPPGRYRHGAAARETGSRLRSTQPSHQPM